MTVRYRSYAEYRTTRLFRIARDVAWRRSRGICEQCRRAPVSEVHHLQYPVWGAFDTPSNLIAVCHDCHNTHHPEKELERVNGERSIRRNN